MFIRSGTIAATAGVSVMLALVVAPSAGQAKAPSSGDPCAPIRSARGSYIGVRPLDPLTAGRVTIMGDTKPLDLSRLHANSIVWGDPSKTLWFRSLYWLASAAVTASETDRADLVVRSVDAAVRFHALSPDPGGADLQRAAARGWDEGTVTRRQEALNCLYSLAPGARTGLVLRRLVAANLDDRRYFGPPLREPHNHGLIANQALWSTGELLNDRAIVLRAVARLRRDFARSFSSQGVNIEGSAIYQFFLYPEWKRVATRLRASGAKAEAAAMDARLAKVWLAARHLIAPDGQVSLIGDGFPDRNGLHLTPDPRAPLVLVDPSALFAARFSWSDVASPYVTMRLGRLRGAHGHDDFGSVTWFAKGNPIIVDPGSYDYSTNPLNTWLESRAAHNVPETATPTTGASGYRAGVNGYSHNSSRGSVSATLTSSKQRSGRIVRQVSYTRAGRFQVIDSGKSVVRQRFTLDPDYRIVRWASRLRRAVTISTSDGHAVRVSVAKGSRMRLHRGRTSPRAGWVAPGWQDMVPATQIETKGKRRIRTTFVALR